MCCGSQWVCVRSDLAMFTQGMDSGVFDDPETPPDPHSPGGTPYLYFSVWFPSTGEVRHGWRRKGRPRLSLGHGPIIWDTQEGLTGRHG